MKIELPENISEITLEQFQKYMELIERNLDEENFLKRKVSIFVGIPVAKMQGIKATDFERINNQIDLALNTEANFQNRFKINGIEFGFIPNFEAITIGEFADLEKYQTDIQEMHRLISVLFRPIKNSQGNRYEIERYKGTETYCELMKQTPLNIVNGALVFFSSLASELEQSIQKYLNEETLRVERLKNTSKIGGGILQLRNWRIMTFLKSKPLLN